MQPDLKGQIALVTGAGRGIGKAIAVSLARCGAHVYLNARTESDLAKLAGEIKRAGDHAAPIVADLSDESQILKLFERINTPLDILINNAGIGFFGPVHGFSTEQFDQIMSLNVRATFLCIREALKLMMPAKSGYIINIASVVGFKGYANQAVYSASKHAMMGLTKSLAVECQPHNIRVSAILPGGVNTEMSAASRPDLSRDVLLAPEDIANSVLYLLSLTPTNAAVDQIYIRRKASPPF